MEVNFAVAGAAATFRWNSATGRADVMVGDDHVTLQTPAKLSTHFQLGTRRTWKQTVGGHDIEVVKDRPRMFGGLRPNTFTVSVDGKVVATAMGR